MKKNIIYIVITIISVIWFCISYDNERKETLRIAEEALIKAVHEDLNNRLTGLDISTHISSFKSTQYKHVEIAQEDGRKTYQLDSVESSKNMDKNMQTRVLHTITFMIHQYTHPDTLNHLWQKELQVKGINHIKTFIDIIISPHQYRAQSRDSLASKHYTSLPTFYIGTKNEMKLQSAIDLTFISIINCNLPLYIFLGIICCCIGGIIASFLQAKNKTKITTEKMKDNSWPSPPKIIRLSDNVTYDLDTSIIYQDGKVIKLSTRLSQLLQLLIKAEDHRMHGADLVKAIWGNNETSLNNLYLANTRLRKELNKIDSNISLVSIKDGYFQLIYPYLSKNERL